MRRPRPFDLICAVLRSRLNGEPLDRSVMAVLERGGVDDRRLVAVASRHRITPAFAACLSDLGLDDRLPSDLRDYFAFMRASNAARNRALRDQLAEIISRLNGLGVEPCLVKGAARLVDGLYEDVSWRFMVDLDVLVPEDQLQECIRALRADGYYEEPGTMHRGEGKHYPAVISAHWPSSVELHFNLAPERFRSIIPTHEAIDNSTFTHSCIGRIRLLKPEYQIIHVLAHRQIFHAYRFYEVYSLSDAIELSLMIKSYGPHLDWSFIVGKFARPDWRRACLASLQSARILVGAQIPEQIACNLLTRLHITRMRGQERFGSMKIAGLVFGWITHGFHRLCQPGKRDFIVRIAAYPNAYVNVLKDHLRR